MRNVRITSGGVYKYEDNQPVTVIEYEVKQQHNGAILFVALVLVSLVIGALFIVS